VGDLQDMEFFESRLRALVAHLERAYPGISIDVDSELAYYNSIRDELLPLITDTIVYCNEALKDGKNILVEGANATSKCSDNLFIHYNADLTTGCLSVIDLDFGTYPYVTSSNPSVGSTCTGLGVSPTYISSVCGIVKVTDDVEFLLRFYMHALAWYHLISTLDLGLLHSSG